MEHCDAFCLENRASVGRPCSISNAGSNKLADEIANRWQPLSVDGPVANHESGGFYNVEIAAFALIQLVGIMLGHPSGMS